MGCAAASRGPIVLVVALVLLVKFSESAGCGAEWADFDTPQSACTINIEGVDYELVFSDEFDLAGRSFADGDDARWTALETNPYNNGQINYYNSSYPRTRDGYLDIPATSEHATFAVDNQTMTEVLQSAMLQSWNKFCFSQGALEYSAQLPGNGSVFGLWPAFWMMGNLGRAVLNPSSAGTWPFNFDECVEKGSTSCEASQCDAMRITACDKDPGYGMHPYQGRSAPEIDVVEVQPGYGRIAYNCTSAPYNATFANAMALQYPLLYTTLQMGPGILYSSDENPIAGCIDSSRGYPMELFPFHYEGARPSTAYDVHPGWSDWSTYFAGSWPEAPLQPSPFTREIIAAATTLAEAPFHSQKVYRLVWNAGPGAMMRWYYDGQLVYELAESMLSTPRPLTRNGDSIGTLQPRVFPKEPMYILLNIDIAPSWGGWPSHIPGSPECGLSQCDCSCYDCSSYECTHCFVDGINVWQWFEDFCSTLPTSYLIDYVRVYQLPGATNVGCDPPEYPTANFIGNQPERFTFGGQEAPLLGVAPGWGVCSEDSDCGGLDQTGSPRGSCTGGICRCASNWTGPTCQSQSAGAALECRGVELEAMDTWQGFHQHPSMRHCVPNRNAYNVTMLLTMVSLACTDKYGARPFKTVLLDPICAQINASYTGNSTHMWQCTAFAQASAVVTALLDTIDLCCDSIDFEVNGAPYLRCQNSRLSMEFVTVWIVVVFTWAMILVAAVVFSCFIYSREAEATSADGADEAVAILSIDDKNAACARALLQVCSPDARRARGEMVSRLGSLLGLQEDSCAAQQRHIESLLMSQLSVTFGDYDQAVRRLHATLLQSAERYEVKTSGAVKRVEKQGDGTSVWDARSTDVLLEEITVFLLIWGESGNLRFMPEFVVFTYMIALQHVRAHKAAPAQVTYLDGIVQPIYRIIFDETFEGLVKGRPKPRDESAPDTPKNPMNYDDWNEAFWNLASLRRLQTGAGVPVLSAEPSERWELLLQADWRAFFTGEGKTFREYRWWYNLLVSHRRVFMLHLWLVWVCFTVYVSSHNLNTLGSRNYRFVLRVMLIFPADAIHKTGVVKAWMFGLFPILCVPAVSAAIGAMWASFALPRADADLLGFARVRTTMAARLRLVHMVLSIALNYFAVWSCVAATASEGALREPFASLDSSTNAVLLLAVATANFGLLLHDELTSERTSSGAFDSNLSFEDNASYVEQVKLDLFWAIILGLKVTISLLLTIPAIFSAATELTTDTTLSDPFQAASLMRDCRNAQHPLSRECPQIAQSEALASLYFYALFFLMVLINVAETLFLYSTLLGLWGGARLWLMSWGIGKPRQGAVDSMQPRDYEGWALSKGIAPDAQTWELMCVAIFDELYKSCLISEEEWKQLDGKLERVTRVLPKNGEARRRLNQFMRSLGSANMPISEGALFMPGLTVLVPHYGESILQSAPEGSGMSGHGDRSTAVIAEGQRKLIRQLTALKPAKQENESDVLLRVGRSWLQGLQQAKHIVSGESSTLDIWAFIVEYHPDEWENFSSLLKQEHLRASVGGAREQHTNIHIELRKWASQRMQTLQRTLAGMMRNRQAMQILLRASLPQLNESEIDTLVDTKFQLLAALQRYGVMKKEELEEVEVLLAEFPSLNIAYIDEVDDATSGERRYFSCLVDGTCPKDEATGRRRPLHRVELPGHPILGNGKGDNQNSAIIFSRGAIIQAIDCNQDHYLEEAFKLPNALAEFRQPHYSSLSGGPTIVGFNEHIFSSLGSLGHFAAGAELAFGVLAQQTMASDLHSRYHYGHPDFLNKLHMMCQGGVSKATRTLNLSEDIYAGMDAVLRGGSVVHRNYFTVGKGRDMGFLSILSFFCKLSSGTAQTTTSRQSYRLGTRLTLSRLLGFYYAHAGYYVGQLHFFHVVYVLLAFTFLCCLSDTLGLLPSASQTSVKLLHFLFSYFFSLFLVVSLLPYFFAACVVFGPAKALWKSVQQVVWGAPIFFAVQSRCIGHYIAQEFAIGGAAYIPTGRGLATQHVPFHDLYKAFALPCFYPGFELLAFIVLSRLAAPHYLNGSPIVMILTTFSAVSLLVGPSALFNPHAFSVRDVLRDLREWGGWLGDEKGWLAYHEGLVTMRKGAHKHGFLLPSKQMLMAFVLVIIVSNLSITPLDPFGDGDVGWRLFQLFYLALPITPLCLSYLLVLLTSGLSRGKATVGPGVLLPGALLQIVVLVAEVIVGINWAGGTASLDSRLENLSLQVISLCACRYFCWRVLMNLCAYVVNILEELAQRQEATRLLIRDPLRVMVGSLALALDGVLGLVLQLPVLLLALVPFLNLLHFTCLFHKLPTQLERGKELADRRGGSVQEVRSDLQGEDVEVAGQDGKGNGGTNAAKYGTFT